MGKSKSVAKPGRPVTYDKAVADEIVDRMAAGESLRSICLDARFPVESTVRRWATDDREGFAAQYTRAREAQMDALADDLLEIADATDADVNRAKLRVDTRKWLMSKIAPKRFGERISKEISGPGGGPVRFDVSGMSDEQLAALETALGGIAAATVGDAGDGEA